MKFLVDMNLSPRWVGFLIAAGLEAVHWSAIGPGNASDHELLQWAAEHNSILLTNDLDFAAILAASGSRRLSVMQIRSDLLTPESIGRAVLAAITQARQELLAGAVVSMDADRARIRILPLAD